MKPLHIIAWAIMLVSLPLAAVYAVAGALYVTEGQGIHPAVAAILVVAHVWNAWFWAGVADQTRGDI